MKKRDYRFKNMKKTESPKITLKVVYELLITSYERFQYFSQTWNLTIAKKASVTSENLKIMKNWISTAEKSKKCNIGKKIWNFKVDFCGGNQLKWWSEKTSPRVENWGKLKKNILKKEILCSKIWKKLKVKKWTQKSSTSS